MRYKYYLIRKQVGTIPDIDTARITRITRWDNNTLITESEMDQLLRKGKDHYVKTETQYGLKIYDCTKWEPTIGVTQVTFGGYIIFVPETIPWFNDDLFGKCLFSPLAKLAPASIYYTVYNSESNKIYIIKRQHR